MPSYVHRPGTRNYYLDQTLDIGTRMVRAGFKFRVPPFLPHAPAIIEASLHHALCYQYRIGCRPEVDMLFASHLGWGKWPFLLLVVLFEPLFDYFWHSDRVTRRAWVAPLIGTGCVLAWWGALTVLTIVVGAGVGVVL